VAGLIEDYALVGDMQSAALVGRDGSVDWLCLPRFDSPAFFAALLGSPDNGHWQLGPCSGGPATRRRYRGDSLVLDSEWDTDDGTVRITDFMPPRDGIPNLVRIVEGVSGAVAVRSCLRLRFDYGSIVPWVRRIGRDLHAVAGPDSVWLHGDVVHRGRDDMSSAAEFVVRPGERVCFVLTWHPSHEPEPPVTDARVQLGGTEQFWSSWSRKCCYDGPYREAVVRSLITLKALTYEPTGGIVAAATTSLPEAIGGVRNWDYRFCWLRDATLTLQALVRSGYTAEAEAWRAWLLRAIAGEPADLQIMYGIAGERRLPELELDWLAGYEKSRPVRVGNGAARQLQLDVYGEVMDALALARACRLPADEDAWRMQRALLRWLEDHWAEPDEGLWEVRGPRRHFTHSKVLAWAAFDAAVHAVEDSGLPGPVERWRAVREEIHAEVCAKAYDADRNTFTQSYGSRELDAAVLLLPQVGFLPATDPRFLGTVEAIQAELATPDGLVLRYRAEGGVDGLPGDEGAFLACSFWLADALHLIGRVEEARALFERVLDLRNDVGLLAEEYDPRIDRQVGNVPQAFSHVGLVNTAHNLLAGARPQPRK
jgi:GH15 family glucan-1,4-alpha-glucosidase